MNYAATKQAPLTARGKHLAWCKERATQYVKDGDLAGAVASMISDMGKRDDTRPPAVLTMMGMMETGNGAHAVQRWIDGFN